MQFTKPIRFMDVQKTCRSYNSIQSKKGKKKEEKKKKTTC